MNKSFINKNLFFLVENGQVLLWNYKDHEQYLLTREYFDEILAVSGTGYGQNEKVFNELSSANIFTQEEPAADAWGWDDLSKIFHIGTKNSALENNENEINATQEAFIHNYHDGCQNLEAMPTLYSEKEGKKIALPDPDISRLHDMSFYTAIMNRKTCRKYDAKPITLNDLSIILFASFGLIHGEEWEDFSRHGLQQTAIRKASAASGGLHIEEAYIVAYRVNDIESGLYHYDVQNHALTLLKHGDFEQHVINMNSQQFYSKGLSFGIYITARFEKSWWKYKHSRSYCAALMDIGHVSQTFQLCSAALNLNTWLTGNFFDDQVEEFLEIDGLNESAILFVGAGIGSGETFPEEMMR
jgi:SagB-type dehydrogenase family enzyme